ncbi:MAG: hypothetical protein JOZ69_15510 [Myxococcales bacterium]|nr:hypothetical protein [Myxococcales bacterium]
MKGTPLVPKALSFVVVAASVGVGHLAVARPPPAATPVDVVVPDQAVPRRVLTLEWNPLPLFTIGKASFNVVVAPVDHHALIVSPFYTATTTQPIFIPDAGGNLTIRTPEQTFRGFGGEIGYRYYIGRGGPRGFFAGPSILLVAMSAKAEDGTSTGYIDYGLALDLGYAALIADRVAVSLGVGAQYTTPDRSIPSQQFPADIYANARLFPRVLVSFGWAL